MLPDWGGIEWVTAIIWVATISMGFMPVTGRWLEKRATRRDCEATLACILRKDAHFARMWNNTSYPTYWAIVMGHIYRNYIGGLPLNRKQAIVETLLANASRRTGKEDIPALIESMQEAELETLGQIVLEGQSFPSLLLARAEMPNAVIMFMMQHPRVTAPMPVTQP
jgi:hypothetical protein